MGCCLQPLFTLNSEIFGEVMLHDDFRCSTYGEAKKHLEDHVAAGNDVGGALERITAEVAEHGAETKLGPYKLEDGDSSDE